MAAVSMMNYVTKLFMLLMAISMWAISINASHAVEVYKSIGSYGEVKYSQHPPKNGESIETIEFRNDGRQNTPGQLAGKTDANQTNNSQSAEQQRVAQLEARIKDQEAQANAQRCQTLRNNLTNLNANGPIYETDASGKREYLDSREIELKRERVQQTIGQYCS